MHVLQSAQLSKHPHTCRLLSLVSAMCESGLVQMKYFHATTRLLTVKYLLQVPVFTIQRDEKYFPKAQEFVPERWVEGCPEEKSLNRHVPGSWMAFGEGTRVCVGQRFALVEAKITLAKLFRR